MKNIFKLLIITLIAGLLSTGCEEYLDVPSDASLTEEMLFSSYKTFQGFLDPCYSMISDANNSDLVISHNIGTESVSNSNASPSLRALNLDYPWLSGAQSGRSIWTGFGSSSSPSAEKQGLYNWWPLGSRIANISLENLKYLKDATQEEKDKLEGQALFFRAYLNFEVARAYGSIPYLDEIYLGENARQPRYWTDEKSGKKDFQAVAEKAARDLQRAAELLPVAWEEYNTGRITKGAAYALLSKVLLYAGSPLYEESSVKGNSAVTASETPYNKDYMKRAAEAAAEVIKMNVYELTPWGTGTGDFSADGYRKIFTTIDGKVPYTKESIFQRWNSPTGNTGKGLMDNRFGRIYSTGHLGVSAGGCENPLLRFMDKFEMKDGTPYKTGNQINGGYDDDLDKFNNQRDPRFQYNYRLHNEKIGNFTTSFELKGLGYDKTLKGPFLMTKFWYPLADAKNNQFGQFNYVTPSVRYAEVLLFYAEAVFEATGNPDASLGGAAITARQALNLVRNRALMPDFKQETYAVARTEHGELATDHSFRLAVRNERCVELAYEGHLWYDLRRWKRSHLLEKQVWILDFSKDYKSVTRSVLQPYLFEMRHYWLPFNTTHTQIYEGFPQNPGW